MSNSKIFFSKNEDSHITEALRLLRTNLHFIVQKKKRTLLFTSTTPGEGKSFVAANYAMSVAISGEKVLIIDCDLRKPRIHLRFDLDTIHGLADILLGHKDIKDVVFTNVEKNLDILPATHISENVTELFINKRMNKLIAEAKKVYDLVILDTPPLLATSDAAILSQYSDGIVFVCGYGMNTKNELLHAKKILCNAGANIYGVVVNKVEKEGYSEGNYGYYSYTHKYYDKYIKSEA